MIRSYTNQDTGTYDGGDTIVYGQADADATVYPYAGSSPIPLDPVDAPTATPRSAITFTYVTYDVTSLGLSFEAPAGWVPDDSISEIRITSYNVCYTKLLRRRLRSIWAQLRPPRPFR